MNPADMLVQVLAACEAFATVPLAVLVGAHHLCLGASVLAVNFSLVPQKTARVSETLKLSTRLVWTPVWPNVFVHMFTKIDVSSGT